ncbi:MAG: hypothetical protein KDC46_07320 [Thermoleophilia bacterium]|nr:hypothetical protein [Thermoleophilia bacterium]
MVPGAAPVGVSATIRTSWPRPNSVLISAGSIVALAPVASNVVVEPTVVFVTLYVVAGNPR